MGRLREEGGNGWRELAVRAGLIYPSALRSSALRAHLHPPRLLSFGTVPQPQQDVISKWNRFAVFSSVSNLDSGVQLSGAHSISVGTVLETLVQGSKTHLDELRLRLSKSLLASPSSEKNRLCDSAKVAVSLASDLQQRNRATVESMLGTKEDGHTASCVLSSDFQSQLAWGVASTHRVGKTWTFFTRFSKDDHAGERLIFQAVHELDAVNKLSTILAATVGHHPQAGFSWTHEACDSKGEARRSVSLKGLCSGDGNFSVSVKAQVGAIE